MLNNIISHSISPLKVIRGENAWEQGLSFIPNICKKPLVLGRSFSNLKLRKYLIYVTHILVIAPLLLYVGTYRKNIHPIIYPILVVLAIMTIGYHGAQALITSHI